MVGLFNLRVLRDLRLEDLKSWIIEGFFEKGERERERRNQFAVQTEDHFLAVIFIEIIFRPRDPSPIHIREPIGTIRDASITNLFYYGKPITNKHSQFHLRFDIVI